MAPISTNLFKRCYPPNQLSHGLLRYFTQREKLDNEPERVKQREKVFFSKIKKLFNLDRKFTKETRGAYNHDYVFFEDEGVGSGGEERFSDFHVFLMRLAIECLHMGFKQKEVIYFLFFTKPELKKIFSQIHQKKFRESLIKLPIFLLSVKKQLFPQLRLMPVCIFIRFLAFTRKQTDLSHQMTTL